MKYAHSLIFLIVILLSGCSDIPNPLAEGDSDTNKQWDKVIGSLLPEDPVPSQIKLEDGNYITANVENVRDGDTLTVSNVNTSYIGEGETKNKIEQVINSNSNKTLGVRFISIDSPEITNGKNEYFGKEAKKAVEKLLYNGKVYLEIEPKTLFDNYDRFLAHVYTSEGVNIQKYLLSNGLARTAYLYDNYRYTKDYRQAEEQAKTKKLNIYSIEDYVKTDDIAGFNMNVSTGFEWTVPKEPLSPEDVVKGMSEFKFRDFFNFSLGGSE